MRLQIQVATGDVLTYPADVAAFKYAQQSLGVDAFVVSRLAQTGIDVLGRLPEAGKFALVKSDGAIAAREVLFIGVEPLGQFDYLSIRRFSQSVLSTINRERPSVTRVAMTLHGKGFGLDEAEAFRAEIAGLLDVIAARNVPPLLERVVIVE
jgi:hypothetical protein